MNQQTKTQQKEGYKETELGELPVDWNINVLNEYCKVFSGFAFKSSNFVKKGVLVVKIGNLQNGTIIIDKRTNYFPKDKISERMEKFVLSEGDILIALTGATTGKVAVVPMELQSSLLNQRVGKFEIFSSKLDKRYFRFHSIYKEFQERVLGNILKSAQGNVSPKQIENIKIPLPPLLEQKKIAYVLSTIQESKEKTENMIKSLKELKKSMMKHLFTYGPISFEDVEKIKLKETEIGEIPEGWDVKEIKNLVEKTKQKDMRKENIEFKYIDVSSIDRDNLRVVSYSLHKGKKSPSRARKIVNKDDTIVATVRPTLKRIAKINEEYDNEICSTAFCVLRAKKEVLEPNYLFYSVQRPVFMDKLSTIQRGASYPAVTDNDIKNQSISLPDLSTQQQISQILSTIDTKIEKEENKKKALEGLFKSMLHNLMTAKIRVKDLEIKNG